MPRRLFLVPALAGLLSPALPAAAECLRNTDSVTGELRQVRTLDATGQPVESFHVVVKGPVCVKIEGTAQAGEEPRLVEGVRNIELVLAVPSEALELGEMLGAEVEARGRFEEAVDAVHTGDVVMTGAEVAAIEGAVAESAPEARVPEAEIDRRIERFIAGFYLSGEDVEEEQIRILYAPTVAYFGRERVPVGEVVRDKTAYYARWPERRYRLVEGSLDVRRVGEAAGIYDVAFEYEFEVRRRGDTRRGRGLAVLTFDLADGEGRIVRETGRLLRRY